MDENTSAEGWRNLAVVMLTSEDLLRNVYYREALHEAAFSQVKLNEIMRCIDLVCVRTAFSTCVGTCALRLGTQLDWLLSWQPRWSCEALQKQVMPTGANVTLGRCDL